MDDTEVLHLTGEDGLPPGKTYKVLHVYIKFIGGPVYLRQRVCELEACEDKELSISKHATHSKSSSSSSNKLLIKSAKSGTVREILIKVGQIVTLGSPLLRVSVCKHPTMLGNTCGDCGITFEDDDDEEEDSSAREAGRANIQPKTVSMLHSMPNLRVTVEEAERLGAADRAHLLEKRKLVLLVDLDQTLLHTTNDNVPHNIKDVHHFRLHPHSPVYHCRLRPYTRKFLARMSELYELHICTFGVREYAHVIAHFLDPDGKLFQQRILSRNECLDPMSKKANLKSLFPCGDELVCIMDDRSDVWHFAPNVVQVLPYHFFQHTGDINAPPGLQKKENDQQHKGFDFSALNKKESERRHGSKVKGRKGISAETDEKSEHETATEGSIRSRGGGGGGGSSSSSTTYSDDEANSVTSDENPMKSTGNSKMNVGTSSIELPTDLQALPPSENGGELSLSDKVSRPAVENNDVDNKLAVNNAELKSSENVDETENNSLDTEVTKLNVGDDVSTEKDDVKSSKATEESSNSSPNDSPSVETEDSVNLQLEESFPSINSDTIDVPDHDDYLLHLEDILKKIHSEFYARYRPASSSEAPGSLDTEADGAEDEGFLPDLKWLVPEIRGSVLKGCNIVFSSVVPQNSDLRSSKAYGIATCLGAKVSEDLRLPPASDGAPEPGQASYTTHLVAANPHTQKVHQAQRCKAIKVVTPDWLWCCMERWERVDERLFPLTPSSTITRNPPHHCCAPYFLPPNASRQNSLDLFYMEDKAKERMMEEVEELLEGDNSSDGSASSGDSGSQKNRGSKRTLKNDDLEDASSSQDSNTGDSSRLEQRRNRRKRRKRNQAYNDDENSRNLDNDDDDEEEELPSVKFRRGENVSGVMRDSDDGSSSSDNSSDMEALDSGEEERLLKMEQELMDS